MYLRESTVVYKYIQNMQSIACLKFQSFRISSNHIYIFFICAASNSILFIDKFCLSIIKLLNSTNKYIFY